MVNALVHSSLLFDSKVEGSNPTLPFRVSMKNCFAKWESWARAQLCSLFTEHGHKPHLWEFD